MMTAQSLSRYLPLVMLFSPVWQPLLPACRSQDTTGEGQDVAAQEQPPAAPETSAGAEAGRAAAEFSQVFERWKGILKDLRGLQAKYAVSEPDELEAIRDEWNAKIAEGEEMIPRLRQTAIAAYVAAPDDDAELEKLLLEMMADDVRQDEYTAAMEIGQAMGDSGGRNPKLLNLLGIAAFATNDFDRATEYLTEADREGSLTEQSEAFYPAVKEVQEQWAHELELREAEAEADDLPRVKLETSAGDIVLELFENEAPETVGNFISLVEKGFYDGIVFHRVIPGFMAQTGCPNGDGTGSPGYAIYCECYGDDYRHHFAGSVSMAKETARNSGGSQFFITLVPTSHLNGKHTVFGRVLEGMDVLPKLIRVDPDDPARAADRSVIKKATVIRKREHEYTPNKVK